MKKPSIAFILTVFLGFSSCQLSENEISPTATIPSESKANFVCLNKTVNQSILVSEVKSKIYGEWELTGVIADVPNIRIPVLKIVFKDILGPLFDTQFAEIFVNGELSYSTNYSLKQIENSNLKSVFIQTDKKNFTEPNIITFNGTIRICDEELMIDTGIAFDAPAYFFRKKK